MSFSIGLDIGGTKIAGALFDAEGSQIARKTLPTPTDYAQFLNNCVTVVQEFDAFGGRDATIGIGVPGAINREQDLIHAPNIVCIQGQRFSRDITQILKRPVVIGNDADCAALSEAVDGAAAGYKLVFGVIMGTGAGGGLIFGQRVIEGANGLTGEWGHLPLPFREDTDGPLAPCGCGQIGCIEKHIAGPALTRLHEMLTGKHLEAAQIAAQAITGDASALATLDRFYTVVAKAMVAIIHIVDPQVIVISGGLNDLPGLYTEVPKRWGAYALRKNLKTLIVPAKHGAMTGLRGAAWLGKGS